MMGFISKIFARSESVISQATARDAAAMAALHSRSFHRGWGEQEVEALLVEPNVLAHRAMAGRSMAGFIMSRLAADEAEILSVAVAANWRGRGVAKNLLTLHLRRLAGLGARTVFLEVDAGNVPALALYDRAGFEQVSRRDNYYPGPSGTASAALVLRRDFT